MKNSAKTGVQLSKVFLNVGQGIILATILARLIQQQSSFLEMVVGLLIGFYTIGIGLYLFDFFNEGWDRMSDLIVIYLIIALFATVSAVYFHFYFKKHNKEVQKKV